MTMNPRSELRKFFPGRTKPHIYFDDSYGSWTYIAARYFTIGEQPVPGANMAAMKFCRRMNSIRLYGEPENLCCEVVQP